MRAFFDVLMTLKPQMIMVYVTSLVTASKERQTGAKSCKAGKVSTMSSKAGLGRCSFARTNKVIE